VWPKWKYIKSAIWFLGIPYKVENETTYAGLVWPSLT